MCRKDTTIFITISNQNVNENIFVALYSQSFKVSKVRQMYF